MSLTEVYAVASFYKAFSLEPRGKNILTVCTGTACHVRGAKMVLNQATGQLGVALDSGILPYVKDIGACRLCIVEHVQNGLH